MLSIVRGSLAAAVVALLCLTAQAEDKKPVKADDKKPDDKKPAKADDKKPVKAKDPYAGQFTFPKAVKLDEKQTEQVEKLQAEFSPKLADLAKKQSGVVSADRIKEASAARKKASDAILTPERVKAGNEAKKGKKGKEAEAAYQEAVKLTDEEKTQLKGLNKVYDETLKMTDDEKKQLADVNKERAALLKEIATKKMAILTDEQKKSLETKTKPKTDK